jgi:hypothetical protein
MKKEGNIKENEKELIKNDKKNERCKFLLFFYFVILKGGLVKNMTV